MLSYKQWKQLNESVGSVTLGLSQPHKIADLHSRWAEMGMLPPALMKKKKPLDVPVPSGPPADPDAQAGDLPPDEKDDLEDDDLDDDDDDDDDDDMDDDDVDGHHHHDDEDDVDDDDTVDDPTDGGPGDDMAPDAHGLPPKKKMPPAAGELPPKMMDKGCNGCMKQSKRMKKEHVKFLKSLQSQMGATKFAPGDLGNWVPVQEDAVIPPTDPNAAIKEPEPQAGDVGFAPQGRVGGEFSEAWANRYNKAGTGSWFSQ